MGWNFDPVQFVPVIVAGFLFAVRARALARRGRPVVRVRIAAFFAGLVALLVAVVSPIDTIGEQRLFSVHMVQHLLIGDLAPLLIVLGLTGALLRPALALPPVRRLRVLASPLIALPLWAANLAVWHVPVMYDAALDDELVHALEHICFFTGGLLLWMALIGPLPRPRWYGFGARVASLAFVWIVGGVLANVFLWSTHPYYAPYVDAPRTWGLSALADQRAGGGVMLVEMTVVVTAVFVVLVLGWLADAELRQARIEQRTP